MNQNTSTSEYLRYLPAFWLEDAEHSGFLNRFLTIFERILTATNQADDPASLGQILDRIDSYFSPDDTESGFLDWLAAWIGLTLNADWSEKQKRAAIAGIIPLYLIRGTKRGLEALLKLYFPEIPFTITERRYPFQVKDCSQVGVKSVVGLYGQPYYFEVTADLSETAPGKAKQQETLIGEFIEREKPVYSYAKVVIRKK